MGNLINPASSIPAAPPGVRLVLLENGLTLIILEDHSAPVISAQAWCKAGSVNEGKWLGAGASHVLEHMLFKGTATRGPSRIDQEVQDAGGYLNAYTSFDRTVFFINVPNTGGRVALDILGDVMRNATLPAEELAKEKQVIRREMDMNQDDPSRRSSRRLFETAYTVSPYRYTVIGYPDVFDRLERDDLVEYYREKYVPNNVFFVVVGDLAAAEVEAQIGEAYARSKARPLVPAVLPEEPRQTAPRETIEEAPIELGHFHYGWHAPDIRHADVPILDVLATLLGGGRSSRLYQEVREKAGLVQSIDAWTYSPGAAGLIGLSAITDPDKFLAAGAAMLEQVDRMKQDQVREDELGKAVKQFIAATLSVRKTMQGQAQDLGGNWMAAGDLNFSERYLAAVKRVTPAELQRVAREYLTAENRTLYALLPKGTAPQRIEVRETILDHPIQKMVLPGGLRLLVKEDHRLPFVEIRTVFKGGVLAESSALSGITLLLARMLLKGTTTRSAEQIAREIESVGGSIDSYGGNNSFGVNVEVLSADFKIGLDLVSDVLLHPALSASDFDFERQMQLANIKALKDQVLYSGSRAMRRAMFGETSYGLDINGSETSVPGIQVGDLQSFHHRLVTPNNCVLAIYGDVRLEEVRTAVETVMGGWPAGETVLAHLPGSPRLDGVRRVVVLRDKKQAVMLIGYPGVSLYNPDRFALELVQEACSDLGSRVFLRIREKLGLAYYVGAQNFVGLAPGFFAFYAGTSPETVDLVESELLQEGELLRTEGLTAEELKRAKAKLIGQKKISRQDLGTYAITTALDELYELGYTNIDTEDAKYEAVTLEQIKTVARKYLDPEHLVIAAVKPA